MDDTWIGGPQPGLRGRRPLKGRKAALVLVAVERRGTATGVRHVARKQASRVEFRRGAVSVVPVADRAIGNLQQWLIGTYHGVSKAQLPVYLNEFAFRHGRRRTPMAAFQTLLGLGTGQSPSPYDKIRGARDLADRNPLGSPETTE